MSDEKLLKDLVLRVKYLETWVSNFDKLREESWKKLDKAFPEYKDNSQKSSPRVKKKEK